MLIKQVNTNIEKSYTNNRSEIQSHAYTNSSTRTGRDRRMCSDYSTQGKKIVYDSGIKTVSTTHSSQLNRDSTSGIKNINRFSNR